MKRERDLEKAERMERLDARRTKWEIRNICTSIMNELVDGMMQFRMEGWRKEVEDHLLKFGLDGERYARSTNAMVVEEEWLMETGGKIM